MVFQNFSSCAVFISSQARWTLSAHSVLCIILLRWLQCLEVVSVDESTTQCRFKTQRSLSLPHVFTFRPFFPSKKRSLISIVTNGLVRIDSTVKKFKHTPFISFCNKPAITWPLGRLANLSPSGAKCDELASAFLAM